MSFNPLDIGKSKRPSDWKLEQERIALTGMPYEHFEGINPMDRPGVREKHAAAIAKREAEGRNGMKDPEVAKRANDSSKRAPSSYARGKGKDNPNWKGGISKRKKK